MKKGIKKRSKLYAFLDAKGVLDKDEFAIARAKREYWSMYKKEWKKRKLKVSKCFEILLNKNEFSVIETCAKRHKRSMTAYIKYSALCYSKQVYLVPDILLVNAIKEQLVMVFTLIQKLTEERVIGYADCRELSGKILAIEKQLLEELTRPQLLEHAIVQELKKDKGFANELNSLLNLHSGDY